MAKLEKTVLWNRLEKYKNRYIELTIKLESNDITTEELDEFENLAMKIYIYENILLK